MTGDERVLLFVVVYLTQNDISSLQDYDGILVNKKTYRELLPLIYRFRRHQKKQMVFFLETFLFHFYHTFIYRLYGRTTAEFPPAGQAQTIFC